MNASQHSTWRNPLRDRLGWRPEDWALLALFMLALLAVSPVGHVIAIIALISIIGIPIYFILALIPGVFIYALLVRLGVQTWRSWRAGSMLGLAIFGVLTALLADMLVFGAWRENIRLDRMASGLLARDRDTLQAAAKSATLAIVRNTTQTRGADTLCDDFCLRLLLTNSSKRVLAVAIAPAEQPPGANRATKRPNYAPSSMEWPELNFDPARQGTLYWLEQRGQCPDIKVSENLRTLDLPERREPGQGHVRRARADEAMRLKIAAGTCLMSRPAVLGEADAALAYGTVKSGEGQYSAAEKLTADTVSAWQVAYADKRGAGFEDVYRATGVSMHRLPWLRVPIYVNGAEFRMKTGWLRMHSFLGARQRFQERPPVEAFAMERLGLNLRLEDGQGPAGGGEAVSRILAAGGALGENDAKIVRDFVVHAGSLSFGRGPKLVPADAARIVAIAADARVSLDWQFGNAVAAVARDAPVRGVELARLLFARLDALADNPAEGQEEYRWRETAGALAGALTRLSDEHLRPYRAQMEKIARTPRKRDRAPQLLRRLEMFGPDIAPLLLQTMRASVSEAQADTKTRRSRGLRGSDGYTGALGAFCRLGSRGAGFLDALASELQTPDNPLLRTNTQIAIAALVQMGASEERVRDIMRIDGGDAKAIQQFGFAMRRAQGQHACN